MDGAGRRSKRTGFETLDLDPVASDHLWLLTCKEAKQLRTEKLSFSRRAITDFERCTEKVWELH